MRGEAAGGVGALPRGRPGRRSRRLHRSDGGTGPGMVRRPA
jgi:hypothetical protein